MLGSEVLQILTQNPHSVVEAQRMALRMFTFTGDVWNTLELDCKGEEYRRTDKQANLKGKGRWC